jgi:2-dehydro-3-deoxygalactonokinase
MEFCLCRDAGAADGDAGVTAEFIGGAFIGGDWGTSRLRLFLCDTAGSVQARAEGPGIGEAGARAAAVLAVLTSAWDKTLPAVLSGMVGSSIGWREAPYCHCPAAPQAIAQQALCFDADGRRIAIAPGLSCRNASGLFDVMRGEETQLLGALRLMPQFAHGQRLFCLPGTHAKWVLIEDGRIIRFVTAMTGELFDLLARHSVLRAEGPVDDVRAFLNGVSAAGDGGGLATRLFSARARVVGAGAPASETASYLSGLLIGAEIAGAPTLLEVRIAAPVVLVGEPALCGWYAKAFEFLGLPASTYDGGAAALGGLRALNSRRTAL